LACKDWDLQQSRFLQSQYVTSHPGQLSLAIPSFVGALSISQKAMTSCGWGLKAGVVREWVAGKTAHFVYMKNMFTIGGESN